MVSLRGDDPQWEQTWFINLHLGLHSGFFGVRDNLVCITLELSQASEIAQRAKVNALYMKDPSSIPIQHDPPTKVYQEWSMSTKPGTVPEHHQRCLKKKRKK